MWRAKGLWQGWSVAFTNIAPLAFSSLSLCPKTWCDGELCTENAVYPRGSPLGLAVHWQYSRLTEAALHAQVPAWPLPFPPHHAAGQCVPYQSSPNWGLQMPQALCALLRVVRHYYLIVSFCSGVDERCVLMTSCCSVACLCLCITICVAHSTVLIDPNRAYVPISTQAWNLLAHCLQRPLGMIEGLWPPGWAEGWEFCSTVLPAKHTSLNTFSFVLFSLQKVRSCSTTSCWSTTKEKLFCFAFSFCKGSCFLI